LNAAGTLWYQQLRAALKANRIMTSISSANMAEPDGRADGRFGFS
jgi:hypothetical protein